MMYRQHNTWDTGQLECSFDSSMQYIVHIVDDCEEDSYIARRLLSNSSHVTKIIHHASARDFFRFLENNGQYKDNQAHAKHVIILDMHMPDMDGLEALKIVRGHPLTEDMPVMMLTGDSSGRTALDAYNSKADAILHKPLQMSEFDALIENL